MVKLRIILCFCLIALFSQSIQGFSSGINQIVSNLQAFQTPDGGFIVSRDDASSIDTTRQALFLATLFGSRNKLDVETLSTFVEGLHNSDGGYGNYAGAQSDIESVRDAVLVYKYIEKDVSSPSEIENFVHGLYDSSNKLFANAQGETGDLKSTLAAFQIFDKLNLLQSPKVTEKAAEIKKNLQSLVKLSTDKRVKYFSSITADNYYSIALANYVGLDFDDVLPWGLYFLDQQVSTGSQTGGFFSDKERSEVGVEDAYYAVSALSILEKAGNKELVDKVNVHGLVDYLGQLPRGIPYAYYGYAALARTSAINSIFTVLTHYEVQNSRLQVQGSRVIQGTQLRPLAFVRSAFNLPHGGLDLSATFTQGTEKKTIKLTFNPETSTYGTTETYSTSEKLGNLVIEYSAQYSVAELETDITIGHTDKKTIGFDITVVPKAETAGTLVEPGSTIGFGTTFSFDVKLGNEKQAKPALVSGDFDVTLTVYDSSNVVVSQNKKDCRSNKDQIKFDYTLETRSLPEGDLRFEVTVSNKDGVHTFESVSYNIPVSMIASDIAFEGVDGAEVPTYIIGGSVKVHMTPANLDMRNVEYYSTEDANKQPAYRRFYMFVYALDSTQPIFRLEGTPSLIEGHSRFTFDLSISPIFDSVGTKQISFFYESAKGNLTELKNYDSKTKELYDESTRLTYKVNADLHLSEIKNAPKHGKLDYGNEIKFSFKVKDLVSGKNVYASAEGSQVFLALRHKDEGRATPFTSSKQRVEVVLDEQRNPTFFQVTWTVNPNAVQGAGSLELYSEGSDRKEIPLLQEGSKEPWVVNVEIGGKIDVEETKFASIVSDEEAMFFVGVELTCQKKRLSDAQLRAKVLRKGELVTELPVTHSSQPGFYQVSWKKDKKTAEAGEYTVEFYREVDRHRLAEKDLKPFFSVDLQYYPDTGSPLPVKTEVLVALLLGAAFLWTSFKKLDIEGPAKDSKKKK